MFRARGLPIVVGMDVGRAARQEDAIQAIECCRNVQQLAQGREHERYGVACLCNSSHILVPDHVERLPIQLSYTGGQTDERFPLHSLLASLAALSGQGLKPCMRNKEGTDVLLSIYFMRVPPRDCSGIHSCGKEL